ncbi:MAG: hypothetical protein ACRDYA_18930 [Egibacteraceae bacterium]
MSTPGDAPHGTPARPPASYAAGTSWAPWERTSGVLLVALVSSLTLEWISLGGFLTRDVKYFHLAAGAFMASYLWWRRPSRRLAPILSRYRGFYGPWVFYLLLVAIVGLAHVEPYFDRSEIIRQALYGATSIVVAAFFLHVDGRRVRCILQWTGIATVGVAVGGISLALLGQGKNPLALIGEALAKGNPDIVSYRLLRLSFRSQELVNVGANLRHKVFSAVMIGLAVALICRDRSSRWRNRLIVVSAVFGALLVMLSLSRSLILCLIIALGLSGIRTFLQRGMAPRQLSAILATLVVIVVLAASPVGSLLWVRFAETGSLEARSAAVVSAAAPASVDAVMFGVEASTVEKSPHNLILDAWLSAGVLGAVSMTLLLFTYLRVWLRQVKRYLTGAPSWVLSLDQLWVVAVGVIPLVRAVTAGNGFHMNDWVCVGIVFGLVEANRRAAITRLAGRVGGRSQARPVADGHVLPGRRP